MTISLPTPIAKTSQTLGMIALSCSLLACGQPAQTASNTEVNIAQTASVSSPKQSSEATESTKEASTKSASSSSRISADAIYTEFDRLTQQACRKQEKVVDNVRYTLCSVEEQGKSRIVSATSSLANDGDGAGYWMNEKGDIYAIRYFHSDDAVVLLPEGKNTIVELLGNRQIKVITDEDRWNQLELGARDQIMEIAEQFESSAAQPANNSERQAVEQAALRQLNNGAAQAMSKATIRKLAIVNNTALLSWLRGETGGMMLLRKEGEMWLVLSKGGGAMSLRDLSEHDVPRDTAEALLTEIDPNWRQN